MNAARLKVERENQCRACHHGPADRLEAAHVWDRSLGGEGFDNPDVIVPLCTLRAGGAGCHELYDAHRLNLWPLLTDRERLAATRLAGTGARAKRRASGAGLTGSVERDKWGPY